MFCAGRKRKQTTKKTNSVSGDEGLGSHGHSVPEFPQHLAALRKAAALTQLALAEKVGVHVVQLRRYEAGTSQLTLDVIKRLAVALGVSADLLLFGEAGRGPDDDLKLQFEAVSKFDAEEKKVVRSLLEGMILKHEARRWDKAG